MLAVTHASVTKMSVFDHTLDGKFIEVVWQVYLSVDHISNEVGKSYDMETLILGDFLGAKNITQKVDCEHFHTLDISILFGPKELITDLSNTIHPEKLVAD